jgi:chromosome segregation ATPase
MAPRPAEIAIMEELADELERWSAFTQGAVDEATSRHRYVLERLQRAERSSALAQDAVRLDTERLDELEHTLSNLGEESGQLISDLARHRDRLEGAANAARATRLALDTAGRANLAEQERGTIFLAAALRDDQRARMGLHQGLETQRTNRRRVQRGTAKAAAKAFRALEAEAHRAATALAKISQDVAALHRRYDQIQVGIADLDHDIERTSEALQQIDAGLNAAQLGHARIQAAREDRDRARAALEHVTAVAEALRAAAATCRDRFQVAEQRHNGARVTYESVQGLTIEICHGLRDELTGEGPSGRANGATGRSERDG